MQLKERQVLVKTGTHSASSVPNAIKLLLLASTLRYFYKLYYLPSSSSVYPSPSPESLPLALPLPPSLPPSLPLPSPPFLSSIRASHTVPCPVMMHCLDQVALGEEELSHMTISRPHPLLVKTIFYCMFIV